MFRILIAEAKQEISSFNPVPSRIADFAIRFGEDILTASRQTREEISGALSILDPRDDVTLVPTYSASMLTSGGLLHTDDFGRIAGEFLKAVASAGPVDAAYFSMHGAMAAQSESDVEGYLLAEARKILGERIPFVVSLDLHGILTDRMLKHADVVAGFHTYPHVDFFETGQRAARALLRILDHGARPITAKIDVPALVRGDELITETGLIKHCIDVAKSTESSAAGMSAGLFWSNPFTDTPELTSSAYAVCDGDAAAAETAARKIADIFWRHHAKMTVPLTSMEGAITRARDHVATKKGGTVILVDAADATSSGASGDSNALLRAAIEGSFYGTFLIPIVDEPAVRAAFDAGVGATIKINVGGALDPARFTPLPIVGMVRMLSEGRFRSEKTREWWSSGPTAVVTCQQGGTWATILLISRPCHLFDRSPFYAHGLDPEDFDAVVVKSPQCEPHMFRSWAAHYIDVDTPGATSANLRSLGHTRCARPMFPLDGDVTFNPVVKLFQRPR